MEKRVNLGIQVLPESDIKGQYAIIDDAISVIAGSGFKYKVCPFETVVECTLKEGLALIEKIHDRCRESGADKMLAYIKIQADFYHDVAIGDKMEKYS